jgi:hypothetical protein
MSRRAWFAFFLAMLLFSWGYIAWWVRCGLVEARMHCVYIGYEWGGSGMGPHLATIHAELTPMAEAELKYSYVIPKTSSMNLFPRPHSIKYSKVYIPLWLFLKSENNLRQDTRYIADEIYRSMGYKVKLYGDYHCNEIIKTAVIEDKGYKLIVPALVLNLRL